MPQQGTYHLKAVHALLSVNKFSDFTAAVQLRIFTLFPICVWLSYHQLFLFANEFLSYYIFVNVVIVIPVYKNIPSKDEKMSLLRCAEIFSTRNINTF